MIGTRIANCAIADVADTPRFLTRYIPRNSPPIYVTPFNTPKPADAHPISIGWRRTNHTDANATANR